MNNFDVFIGPRGCGVSSQIAELAVENDGVIIVPTLAAKRAMVNKVFGALANSMEAHRADVYTVHELIDGSGRGIDYTRPIYIDNFDECFTTLLSIHHVKNKVVCYGTTMEDI